MEHLYNQGNTANLLQNVSEFLIIYHKSHIDWPGMDPVPPRCQTGV